MIWDVSMKPTHILAGFNNEQHNNKLVPTPVQLQQRTNIVYLFFYYYLKFLSVESKPISSGWRARKETKEPKTNKGKEHPVFVSEYVSVP